jgi:hypothetical protein
VIYPSLLVLTSILVLGYSMWLISAFPSEISAKPPIHKFEFHYPPTPEQEAMLQWRAATIAADPASDWKTPIKFDALVVDETNQPLADAKVQWITTNVRGNGYGDAISGSDGRFSIDTNGKGMDVLVQKDGYRTVERGANFEFADFTNDNYYDNDKEHPFVFHLRKIPPFEPIYIHTGIFREKLEGNKVTVDPETNRQTFGTLPEGMWIQLTPGPHNGADHEQYDIVLGTSSGRGVILVTGDSDEKAPDVGYQNPLDTQVKVDYDKSRFINMKAFFADGAGHYGSMTLDIELGGHKLTLGYYLKYNPGGGSSLSAPAHSEFQINKNAY